MKSRLRQDRKKFLDFEKLRDANRIKAETKFAEADYDLWMRVAERFAVTRLDGRPLTRLGRPQLSAGGLSGNTTLMRVGEMRVYVNYCRRRPLTRMLFLPAFIGFSLLKHLYSWLRRSVC